MTLHVRSILAAFTFFVVYTVSVSSHTVVNGKCPPQKEWSSRCPMPLRFHCKDISGELYNRTIQFCYKYLVPEGHYLTVTIHEGKEVIEENKCVDETFSPDKERTNSSTICPKTKSACAGNGQYKVNNGSESEDRLCACRYKEGWVSRNGLETYNDSNITPWCTQIESPAGKQLANGYDGIPVDCPAGFFKNESGFTQCEKKKECPIGVDVEGDTKTDRTCAKKGSFITSTPRDSNGTHATSSIGTEGMHTSGSPADKQDEQVSSTHVPAGKKGKTGKNDDDNQKQVLIIIGVVGGILFVIVVVIFLCYKSNHGRGTENTCCSCTGNLFTCICGDSTVTNNRTFKSPANTDDNANSLRMSRNDIASGIVGNGAAIGRAVIHPHIGEDTDSSVQDPSGDINSHRDVDGPVSLSTGGIGNLDIGNTAAGIGEDPQPTADAKRPQESQDKPVQQNQPPAHVTNIVNIQHLEGDILQSGSKNINEYSIVHVKSDDDADKQEEGSSEQGDTLVAVDTNPHSGHPMFPGDGQEKTGLESYMRAVISEDITPHTEHPLLPKDMLASGSKGGEKDEADMIIDMSDIDEDHSESNPLLQDSGLSVDGAQQEENETVSKRPFTNSGCLN